MPIQYAKFPKQPGENEQWEFEYVAGKNMATGASLTGATVQCFEIPSKTDTTTGTETTATMVEGISRVGNVVYWRAKGGTHGKWYKFTLKGSSDAGETGLEEEIVFQVVEQ